MSPASVWQNALIRATRRTYKPALALPLLVLLSACSGTAPDNLGIHDGQLSACPDSPNCVNSQASDARHAIEPLPLRGTAEETQARLKALLSAEPRVSVVAGVDVRSASRLGYADFDVNRERIEHLRQRLSE